MGRETGWVWIAVPTGRVLAFLYEDPTAGPSAKGGFVGDPPTADEVRRAIDEPHQTFRSPKGFGAVAIGAEEALRLGLPKDPPWIGFFIKGKPVPPPRGEASRTVIAVVRRGGVPVHGARVRIGYAIGPARELVPLDTRTTDYDGRCEFPLAPTKPIVALAELADASSRLVDVPDGELVELEIATVGALEGTVRQAGVPVRASISITGRDGGVHRVQRADATGRYVIDGIVPGTYEVRVEGIDPRTLMTAGTPTWDEIVVGDNQLVIRDYTLVAGVPIRIAVAIENQDHDGDVYLFAGTVAPPTLPELRELYHVMAKSDCRSANSTSRSHTELTTRFADVLPGTYTVCISPSDRRGEAHAAQPVVSQTVTVGTEPVDVAMVLPRLRPR